MTPTKLVLVSGDVASSFPNYLIVISTGMQPEGLNVPMPQSGTKNNLSPISAITCILQPFILISLSDDFYKLTMISLWSVPIYKVLPVFAEGRNNCVVIHTLTHRSHMDDFQLKMWGPCNRHMGKKRCCKVLVNLKDKYAYKMYGLYTIEDEHLPDLPAPSLPSRASLMSFIVVDGALCWLCFFVSKWLDSPSHNSLLFTLLSKVVLHSLTLSISLALFLLHSQTFLSSVSPPTTQSASCHKVNSPSLWYLRVVQLSESEFKPKWSVIWF